MGGLGIWASKNQQHFGVCEKYIWRMYGISAFKFNVLALEPGSFYCFVPFHFCCLYFSFLCSCVTASGCTTWRGQSSLPAVPIVLKRGRGRRRSASPSLGQPGVSKITHILYLTLRWPLLTQPTPTYPHASSSGPSQSTSYLPSLVGVKIVIGPGWSLMADERMDEVGGCSFSIIYMYNRDAFFIKLLNGIRDSFFTISSICFV